MSDYEKVEQAFQHILKKYAQRVAKDMSYEMEAWMDIEQIKGTVKIETSLKADMVWSEP